MIVVDVKKEIGDRTNDVTQMAYYMEKDVCLNVTKPTKKGPFSPHLLSTLSEYVFFFPAGENSAPVQEPGKV